MMNQTLKLLSLFGLGFLLLSCEKTTNETTDDPTLEKTADALVRVDSDFISEEELDAAIIRTVGEMGAFQLDDRGRRKVLESLVLSKAMSKKQLSQMDEDSIRQVDFMTNAYREELLTKMYLKESISPVPVTEKMILDYYNKNPDRFGGKTIRSYEAVKGLTKLNGPARDELLSAIEALKVESNWQENIQQLKSKGLQIEWVKGAVTSGVLTSEADQVIERLEKEQASDISFIGGVPHIFRVVDEHIITPRPLSEVKSDIRKSLSPLQLKKAVKKAAEEILKETDVEYFDNEESSN